MNPFDPVTQFKEWREWELTHADDAKPAATERRSEPREPNREPAPSTGTTRPSSTPPPSSASRPSTTTTTPRAIGPAMLPGTSPTPPNYVDQRRNELLTQGAMPDLPQGAIQISPTRAITGQTTFNLYSDYGLWVPTGFAPNNADRSAAMNSVQERNRSTGQNPYANLAPFAGTGGTLTPEQTPQLPTFAGATQPGFGVPQQGRGYMFSGESLNQLGVNPRGTTNGPVVQEPPGRAPASMGFGPGVSTNIHTFSQRPGGTTPAQRQFPSVQVSVPGDYQPGPSGFSLAENGGAFRAFDIPINAGPTGTGLIQMSGPTNMQIGNTGYLTSGGPAVDPFAVYGRQGSPDAAVRAVQLAQLADERNALFARGYSPQNVIDLLSAVQTGPSMPNVREYFTGSSGPLGPAISAAGTVMNAAGAGGGLAGAGSSLINAANQAAAFAAAARAGGAAPAGAAPPGLSAEEYAAWLEEQGGGGESFGSRLFGGGGSVATRPLGGRPDLITNEPIVGIGVHTGKRHFLMGEDNADRDRRPDPEAVYFRGQNTMDIVPLSPPRFAEGGTVTTDPNAVSTTPAATTPAAPFDPFDPSIVAPWQQEAQNNALRQDARNKYNYRWRAGGMEGPTAIEIEQGDAPAQELAPNLFYDTTKQVNRGLSNIIGAQEDLRGLGPEEDMVPVNQRVADVGTVLDQFERIRQLELQRVGAQATDEAARSAAQQELNALNAQYDAAYSMFFEATLQYNADPVSFEARQNYLNAQARLANVVADRDQAIARTQAVSPALLALDAQLGALRTTLPEGASEGSLQTELGQLRERLSKNQKRVDLSAQVKNLAAMGVPKLNQTLSSAA